MATSRTRPNASSARKILSLSALVLKLSRGKRRGRKVVFTNGVYDLVHPGHVALLEKAKALGDILVVGVNSDRSSQSLNKAPGRPIVGQADRARVIAGLGAVDYVVVFDEPTPIKVIERLLPDVLVKGADWTAGTIVGSDAVKAADGRVVRISLVAGRSTTALVERIRAGKSALDA